MSLNGTNNTSLRRLTRLINPHNLQSNGKIFSFVARATAWDNDTQPPDLDDSIKLNEYQIFEEMLFGKIVASNDTSLMANRYDWVTGTVYAQYDDQDTLMFQKNFFVLSYEGGVYSVFKCLYNVSGIESTAQPKLSQTNASDPFYATSDGYQWKYLYSFDSSTFTKFATDDYIPVTANSAVVGNATSGGISTYDISSGGGPYNSYTNGYFTDIAVGGNSSFFGIQGPDTSILEVSQNTFTVSETVTQTANGVTANGVVVKQEVSGNVTVLTLRNVSNQFVVNSNITGVTSNSAALVIDFSSPTVSSNAEFYTGCSLYISSGTGAGQIGFIEGYFISGTARRVLLANSFTITPDFTSKYVIAPRAVVNGDGTGAEALAIIDPNTKQLQQLQVVNTGINYTYANVSLVGNTGSTSVVANNAVVRAIISPRGGHGYDVASELNATNIGYSITYEETEDGTIPGDDTTYRRIGLVVNPLFANVSLTYSYTNPATWASLDTEIISGSLSGAQGTFNSLAGNTINLTNVSGMFQNGDVLTSTYANGVAVVNATSNAVISAIAGQTPAFDNRLLLICPTSTHQGTFVVGEQIAQSEGGIDFALGVIQALGTSGNNTLIYLTETKGTFQPSDIGSNSLKYISDFLTRQKTIEVDSIVAPALVPYTGDLAYVENINPTVRNSLQSETIKIVLNNF